MCTEEEALLKFNTFGIGRLYLTEVNKRQKWFKQVLIFPNMQSDESICKDIIEYYEAVRLLINIYMIKKAKSSVKRVDQEKFIDIVRKEFKDRDYRYSRKKILFTWKYLLDTYQYYKTNFTSEQARKTWAYYDLMNNCFDRSKSTLKKFKNEKWTLFLIECFMKHKFTLLDYGLTMDVLQAVENDFINVDNCDINQRDIYNQYVFLRRFYKQNKKMGYYKQALKYHAYFTSLKKLFEEDDKVQSSMRRNELESAVNPITEPEKYSIENIVGTSTAPFTSFMQDILLNCFKKYKTRIQKLKGNVDEDILNEALEEFNKQGYSVTRQSISNEWNDLSCRYELIKNTIQPEKWPFFTDMRYICAQDVNEDSHLVDDIDNQSTIGSIIVENLRKNQSLKSSDYAVLTERLLSVYEANSREFLEITEILTERNLLREETNYLLSMLVEKFNKK